MSAPPTPCPTVLDEETRHLSVQPLAAEVEFILLSGVPDGAGSVKSQPTSPAGSRHMLAPSCSPTAHGMEVTLPVHPSRSSPIPRETLRCCPLPSEALTFSTTEVFISFIPPWEHSAVSWILTCREEEEEEPLLRP